MRRLILMMFVLLLAAGCSLNPFEIAKKNVANSAKLRVGMTKSEVLAIMGEPVKNETFNRPDVWFYYFNMNWGDGFITEDECFPLVFEDSRLVGWGNAYYTRSRLERKDRVPRVKLDSGEKAEK